MFVIQDRDIKIIYKPKIDESRITDVYFNDDGEKCFDYEFFFDADLRVALDTGNFKVRITLRKTAKEKKVKFLSDISDVTPLGLTRSLFRKDSDNKLKLRVNDRTGLIKRSFIDLTSYVPNFKVKNSKRLSDRVLFGTIKTTGIFKVADIRSQGLDINLPQRNMLRKRDVSDKKFIQNYQIAIKNGVDPSSLTIPIDSMTPADPRKRASFTEKRQKKSSKTFEGARDTSMKLLEMGDLNPVSISDMSDSDSVGLTVEKVDRVKIISKKMTIKKKSLRSNKFYVKFDVMSKQGVIVQSLSIQIDHLQNLKDYYVPRKIVNIGATTSNNAHQRRVSLGIVVPDQTISGYSLFQRKLSPTTIYSLSPFYTPKKSKTLSPFKRIASQKTAFRSRKRTARSIVKPTPVRKQSPIVSRLPTNISVPRGSCLYITRVTTTGKLGTKYGNFNQATVRGGPILANRLSFMSSSGEDGIKLTLMSGVEDHVSGMCFVRRDISHGVTRARWRAVRTVASFPERGTKGFVAIDYAAIEGRTYEYKAKIFMKNGISKLSINSRYEKYVKPSSAIISSMTNFSYTSDDIGSALSVSFDIVYSVQDTDADILLKLLSDAGLTDLYSDELSEIKENLSTLVSFRVERFDVDSGETVDLGIATSGTFTDSYLIGSSPPTLNSNYIYRISPLLVSPDDVVNSITSGQSPQANPALLGSTRALNNPSFVSRTRSKINNESDNLSSLSSRQESFTKSKSSRDISGRSLRIGTLSSATSSESPLEYYRTGDNIDKSYSTGEIAVKINSGKITFGGHGGPIVRWSIESSGNYVDYFVVIAKKQGSYQVVGNCHAFSGESFTFIDYVSVGYVGQVEYFVVAVRLDGSTSSRQSVGSTVMIDTNTKFRRGN